MLEPGSISSKLFEKIKTAENLPSLPAVAFKVLQLIHREDISVTEIAHTIEQDPALAAKILKVANSSLFALPNKIASLPQATVVMGLRTVKVMALSFSLVQRIGEDTAEGFDYERYWKRSITTAVSSHLLAEKCDPAVRDEAFIAGLLTDLGMLAAIRCAKDEYQTVVDEYKQGYEPIQKIEQRHLDSTHAAIGSLLLKHWHLPEYVVVAVGHHHDPVAPPLDESGHMLGRLVWTAAQIADLFCESVALSAIDKIAPTIVETLNAGPGGPRSVLTEVDAETILRQIDQHVRDTAKQISLRIADISSFDELRMAAMAQLANLSMSAELDRAEASRRADAAKKEVETLSLEKQQLTHRAATDGLTGIANRKAFDDTLAEWIMRGIQNNQSIGLIMLDLDHFKKINDTYGHLFGDEVLKVIAASLRRFADGSSRYAARYGGEEFAVIGLNLTLRQMTELAESIRRDVLKIELRYGTQLIRITTSLGVALADPKQGDISSEWLIEQADRALLRAKQTGRNRTAVVK